MPFKKLRPDVAQQAAPKFLLVKLTVRVFLAFDCFDADASDGINHPTHLRIDGDAASGTPTAPTPNGSSHTTVLTRSSARERNAHEDKHSRAHGCDRPGCLVADIGLAS
jgi:hypothetical protein